MTSLQSFSNLARLKRLIDPASHCVVAGALAADTELVIVSALGDNPKGVHLVVAATKERGVQLVPRLEEIAGNRVRVIAGWTYPTKEAFKSGLGKVPKGECVLVVWAGKCNGLRAFLQLEESGARALRSIVIDDAGTLRRGTCGPQLCYSRGGIVHNEVRRILTRHPDARVALVCPELGDVRARRELTDYLARLVEGKSRRKKKRIQILQGEDNLNTLARDVKITSVWTQKQSEAVAHALEFVRKNQGRRGVVLVAAKDASPDVVEVRGKLQCVDAAKWSVTNHDRTRRPIQTLVASGKASAVVALGDATPALRWVVFLGVTSPAQVAKAAHRLRPPGEILLVGCEAYANAALEAIESNSKHVPSTCKETRKQILRAGTRGVEAWKSICNPKDCAHARVAHNIGATCDPPCTSRTPLSCRCVRACGEVRTPSRGKRPPATRGKRPTATRGKRPRVASVDVTHSSDNESKVDLTHSSDDESKVDLTLSSDDESNAGDGANPAATVSPPGRADGPAESGTTFASWVRVWRTRFKSNMEVPASTVVEEASRIQRRTRAGGSPYDFSDSDAPDEPSPPPPRVSGGSPLPSDDDDDDDSVLNTPVRRAPRALLGLDETQNDEEDDSDVVDMTLSDDDETGAAHYPAAAVTPPPKKRPRTSSS